MKKGLVLLGLLLIGSRSFAQGVDPEWKTDVQKMLSEYLTCATPIDDQSPCNYFLGRALKRVYGIKDFETGPDKYLSANDIADFVAGSDKWTKLGDASEQATLDSAAGYANAKKAIIAVRKGETHGHVALILPGEMTFSTNWQRRVPNSASFFYRDPKNSYVGKGLAAAFKTPSNVVIYGRNY